MARERGRRNEINRSMANSYTNRAPVGDAASSSLLATEGGLHPSVSRIALETMSELRVHQEEHRANCLELLFQLLGSVKVSSSYSNLDRRMKKRKHRLTEKNDDDSGCTLISNENESDGKNLSGHCIDHSGRHDSNAKNGTTVSNFIKTSTNEIKDRDDSMMKSHAVVRIVAAVCLMICRENSVPLTMAEV